MGVVTVFLKIVLKKQIPAVPGVLEILQGDIVISGLDSPSTSWLKERFPELVETEFPEGSQSPSVLKFSKLSTEGCPIDMELTMSAATEYLNALDGLDYAVHSATSDSAEVHEGFVHKFYIWTLQQLKLTYEIYEGSLGTYGPLPLLSWTVYVNGLSETMRRGMQKFFPELLDSVAGSMTVSQNDKTRTCLNLGTTMSIITTYLNWMDSEGFKVVGSTFDSSVYSGGVTKTIVYTMQM